MISIVNYLFESPAWERNLSKISAEKKAPLIINQWKRRFTYASKAEPGDKFSPGSKRPAKLLSERDITRSKILKDRPELALPPNLRSQ